jgi:hypothetical protein
MAWTTTPYCTRTDVKTALDPNLSTADDTFIDSLILQAQSDIDREVGYSFQQDGTTLAPATRYYDGTGQATLFIDDLISLNQVLEVFTPVSISSSGVYTAGTTVTTDITGDIILKPNNTIPAYLLQRRSGLPFEEGVQNYKVLGVFGEPVLPGQFYPGVPNDIMRACIRLAIHYYKMRDTNYSDMTQEQGGVRERYTKTMPQDVVEILDRYKRRFFIGRWG